MSSVTRRIPFIFNDSADEPETGRVLDEIEQEEVIESLKAQNERSNRQTVVMLRSIVTLAVLLHLVALIQSRNPLDIFFDGQAVRFTLLTRIATLFNASILSGLALSDWTGISYIRKLQPITARVAYGLTAATPAVCMLTMQGVNSVAWASFALLITGIVDSIRRSNVMGKESLVELEQSRYNAKGA